MNKKEILELARNLPAKQSYAVKVWTREDVQAAHDDLMIEGRVYPQDFEEFEKNEILDELELQSRKPFNRDMTWENLRRIIIQFSESRDERDRRLRCR
jgi:hypothetical protein